MSTVLKLNPQNVEGNVITFVLMKTIFFNFIQILVILLDVLLIL